MTKQHRSFTPEFKREAADLVLKQNYSYIEASRSLGSNRPSNISS
nr:transposase [Pseudomonas viridiflava]